MGDEPTSPAESGDTNATRRRFLVGTAATGTAVVAGCLGGNGGDGDDSGGTEGNSDDDGGTEGNGGDTTLTMWDHVGEDEEDPNSVWVMETGGQFEEETGATFELEGHPDRLTEKVLTNYQTNDAPDIVHDFSEQFNQYVDPQNVDESPLMAIDDYVGDLPDETYDVIWPGVTFDGSVYGVPHTVNARNWFYNETVVEEAGYDPSSLQPESLGELEQLIVDITENTDALGWVWEGGATAYNWYYPQHFMRTWFGTEYVEPRVTLQDGSEGLYTEFIFEQNVEPARLADAEVTDVVVRADSDEMTAVVSWMKRMREEGYVPDDVLTLETSDILTNTFANQQVGLVFSGPWGYNILNEHVSDFEWSVFPAPTSGETGGVSGEGYFIAEPGKPLMVIDQTDSADAAGEFFDIWFSEERQKEFVSQAGTLSIRPELNTEANFEIAQLAGLGDIVEQATFYDGAEKLPDADLWNTTGSVIQSILSGDRSVEGGLGELQSTLVDRYDEALSE